jgi:hypothetical protein
MAEKFARKEVQEQVGDYLRSRREFGLSTTILNVVLEPPNPFEPQARRQLRKAFVLAVLWLLTLAGVFAYFNLRS